MPPDDIIRMPSALSARLRHKTDADLRRLYKLLVRHQKLVAQRREAFRAELERRGLLKGKGGGDAR